MSAVREMGKELASVTVGEKRKRGDQKELDEEKKKRRKDDDDNKLARAIQTFGL